MGNYFLATHESSVHANYKVGILSAGDTLPQQQQKQPHLYSGAEEQFSGYSGETGENRAFSAARFRLWGWLVLV